MLAVSRPVRDLCAMLNMKPPLKWLPMVFVFGAVLIAAETSVRTLAEGGDVEWTRWGFAWASGLAAFLAWRIVLRGGKAE